MPLHVPVGDYTKLTSAAYGIQDQLVFTQVPAGAAQSLVGTLINGSPQLTVAGHYYSVIPLSGITSKLEVHLKATFTTATVTTAVSTVFYTGNPANAANLTTKTAASGTGAMTTTVRQTSTLTGMAGEQYVLIDINVTGTADVTFTQAEFNGL